MEEYVPRPIDSPCFPAWISNDQWFAPETNLETCTTYNHFYKPYPLPSPVSQVLIQFFRPQKSRIMSLIVRNSIASDP